MIMKKLPNLERPYEKLELYGASNLSNSELLATLLISDLIFTELSSCSYLILFLSKICPLKGGITKVLILFSSDKVIYFS